jgi:membrane protease YdiL (CAAX protease family)
MTAPDTPSPEPAAPARAATASGHNLNPVREVRDFIRAALVTPVARDHTETDAAFRRRRLVAVVTLVVGAVGLAFALRIQPGDPMFYVATLGLAAVWTVGALVSGPLHLVHAHTRAGGDDARPIVQSLALGALLLALFLVGAVVVAQVPVLRDPVEKLLDHARLGSLAIVAVLTAVNGIAEELYFRGALYSAVGRRHAVAITTVVYALTTVGAGIPLLVLAAGLLGLLTALQRRVTGGILGPVVTHLTWSLGMLFLLPLVLSTGS